MKGLARLKKYYRRLNNYIDPKAVILMYHRVAELKDYTYPISVTPHNFSQQMEYLRRSFRPVWLDELAEATKRGSIPRRAVAITFDDGYADNYLYALPILEKFQIPATIFVSSNYIDRCREYWWDDLERIFLSTEIIPKRLEINIQGREYSWNLETVGERRSICKELHTLIKPLYPSARENLLDTLSQWAGIGRDGRVAHRPMTRDELEQMARSPVIQIGAHTVHHPQLAALPVELQNQEIMQGRKDLESIIGKPVNTFSYPFGGQDDFSTDTVNAVKKAGFMAACSTQHTRVVRGADVYRLPRYWVGDWGIDEFQKQLSEFFQR